MIHACTTRFFPRLFAGYSHGCGGLLLEKRFKFLHSATFVGGWDFFPIAWLETDVPDHSHTTHKLF